MSALRPNYSTEEVVALLELTFGKPVPVRASSLQVDAAAGERYNEVADFLFKLGYDMMTIVHLRQQYYHASGLNSGSPIDAIERKYY